MISFKSLLLTQAILRNISFLSSSRFQKNQIIRNSFPELSLLTLVSSLLTLYIIISICYVIFGLFTYLLFVSPRKVSVAHEEMEFALTNTVLCSWHSVRCILEFSKYLFTGWKSLAESACGLKWFNWGSCFGCFQVPENQYRFDGLLNSLNFSFSFSFKKKLRFLANGKDWRTPLPSCQYHSIVFTIIWKWLNINISNTVNFWLSVGKLFFASLAVNLW